MSQSDATTSQNLRKVPVDTPMFKPGGPGQTSSNLTRTWIDWLEWTPPSGGGGGTGSPGPFERTLLLKDLTVGNDIADHVTVYGATSGGASTCFLITGTLRKTISADLTARLNVWVAGVSSVVGSFTIPMSTALNTPVLFTTFTTSAFPDKAVLSWDVTASDGQQDPAGIASYTTEWTPN